MGGPPGRPSQLHSADTGQPPRPEGCVRSEQARASSFSSGAVATGSLRAQAADWHRRRQRQQLRQQRQQQQWLRRQRRWHGAQHQPPHPNDRGLKTSARAGEWRHKQPAATPRERTARGGSGLTGEKQTQSEKDSTRQQAASPTTGGAARRDATYGEALALPAQRGGPEPAANGPCRRLRMKRRRAPARRAERKGNRGGR